MVTTYGGPLLESMTVIATEVLETAAAANWTAVE